LSEIYKINQWFIFEITSIQLLDSNMSGQVKKWYVVRAISGKEKKAKEYIESEISRRGLQQYVSQVLIPTEKVYSVRNGKRVTKERNLFPGYVLIEADLGENEEIAHIITSVPNVLDFLSEKDHKPIPIQDREVNRILGKMDEMYEQVGEMTDPFIIGESVKIIDGPFSNFTGIIDSINEDKKKLNVEVKIFGRKTPVELSFIQVEKE
jgi:transcription termination/antitermination factor NusG